jgi:hypothetical protein
VSHLPFTCVGGQRSEAYGSVYFVPTFLLALVALPVAAYTAEPGLARSLLATAAGLYGAIFVYSEFFSAFSLLACAFHA